MTAGDSALGGGGWDGGFCVHVTCWGRNQLGAGLWCQCFILEGLIRWRREILNSALSVLTITRLILLLQQLQGRFYSHRSQGNSERTLHVGESTCTGAGQVPVAEIVQE